jgi:hypothetical protein
MMFKNFSTDFLFLKKHFMNAENANNPESKSRRTLIHGLII